MPPEIDLYCERTTAGWWDEPLGLMTNAAFLVAAYLLSKKKPQSFTTRLLIVWLALIGIGSGLFHAFANYLTLLMDVIPIQGFILTTIWALYGLHLKQSSLTVVAIMIGFVMVSSAVPSELLNGSMNYLPAWLLLAGATWFHPKGLARTQLALASILFPISLGFRAIDRLICDLLPFGTHFIWHLCNAIVLYLIVRAHQLFLESTPAVGESASCAYNSERD